MNFDYKESLFEIDQMIAKMPEKIQDQERAVLRKIGNIVKKWVQYFLHRSGIEERAKEISPSNYDGSRPYEHVKDDVSYTVRKSSDGNLYVSIKGGKKTGYKWHFINDGHVARDGRTWVPGTNFMEKALLKAQGEVELIINDMVKKVID